MSKWDEDRRTIEKLRSALKLCREALDRVEWVADEYKEDASLCPWCSKRFWTAHAPTCARTLALQAANEALT